MATLTRYVRDPVGFIDAFIPLNAKRQPWQLTAYQRRVLALAFQWDAAGRLAFRMLVWGEPKAEPLDLEDTLELFLREAHWRYRVERILVDPYQMHHSITTLQRAGLRIEPFPQTGPNLTRMASALYELIKGGNLRLYPDAELRWMAMNTVAIETGRGLRIGKEKGKQKIDGIVALSMACVGCLDAGPAYVGPYVW